MQCLKPCANFFPVETSSNQGSLKVSNYLFFKRKHLNFIHRVSFFSIILQKFVQSDLIFFARTQQMQINFFTAFPYLFLILFIWHSPGGSPNPLPHLLKNENNIRTKFKSSEKDHEKLRKKLYLLRAFHKCVSAQVVTINKNFLSVRAFLKFMRKGPNCQKKC